MRVCVPVLVALIGLLAVSRSVVAAEGKCLAVEVYLAGESERDVALKTQVSEYAKSHPGLAITWYDVAANDKHKTRYAEICGFFKRPATTPAVYVCGGLVQQPADGNALARELERLTTMIVYTRTTCPHCAEAKHYLPQVQAQYPALRIQVKDIGADASAMNEMHATAAQRGVVVTQVPDFAVCGQMLTGFDRTRIEALLKRWSKTCGEPKQAQ